jgi:hypothetical protein
MVLRFDVVSISRWLFSSRGGAAALLLLSRPAVVARGRARSPWCARGGAAPGRPWRRGGAVLRCVAVMARGGSWRAGGRLPFSRPASLVEGSPDGVVVCFASGSRWELLSSGLRRRAPIAPTGP